MTRQALLAIGLILAATLSWSNGGAAPSRRGQSGPDAISDSAAMMVDSLLGIAGSDGSCDTCGDP